MKKNILISALTAALLCLSQLLNAVPAKPGKITITQPDGTTITVRVHGDEWFHYVTDESGNLLEENGDGMLVKSHKTMADIEAKMAQAQAEKNFTLKQREETLLKAQVQGTPKIPVILVEFKNKSFSISNPQTAFDNLLNQRGYSANGATGSVIDYYTDQSRGRYQPQFVVMPVVTLANNMSTYGSTDSNARNALIEACQSLNSTVDFSQFDNDGDGKIDMALMYYAGYNEAEGASSETIWPHQSTISSSTTYDGVRLSRYFCTSELKGTSGSNMCGIGTTCHEFAHSLGLPDFYDTNYNDYGDGLAGGTYNYDVMCSGSYNNNGRTPPWMGAEELVMLGWMDNIPELTSVGTVSIPSIGVSTPVAYKSPASVTGEYFLYECRPGTDWDAYLSPGLLVYHVDKSTAHSITWKTTSAASNTKTAYQLWNNWESYNAINCLGSHPCYYIVPSGNTSSLNYSGSNFTFPGSSNVKAYSPVEWSGANTGFTLSQISFNSTTKVVTFNLANDNDCIVSGVVMDSEGYPISGATVTIGTVSAANAQRAKMALNGLVRQLSIRKAGGTVLSTATTNAAGEYSFTLDNSGTYILEASKTGYVSKSATIDVSHPVTHNFSLLREGETLPSEIFTYPTDGEWLGLGYGEPYDLMFADIFPSSLMGAYEGKQIKSISFVISADDGETPAGDVHALIDFGSERQACVKVSNPVSDAWNTVDVSDLELIIPEGKDIYAGYALKNWPGSYPAYTTTPSNSELCGCIIDEYNLSSTDWVSFEDYVFMIKLTVGDYTPSETGYNFIEDPNGGTYPLGADFALNLVETSSDRKPNNSGIAWFYDDEPVRGSSVRLSSAGSHTITAKFTTESGHRKVVELDIEVTGGQNVVLNKIDR